jgi:oxaloacetate decarboxylase (Na+ extruding) subunit gamma
VLNAEQHLFDEALWVMLLGMGIVFAFLTLLVLLMYASQWVFGRYQAVPPPPSGPSRPGGSPEDPALLAAIVSAVHRYRSGM